MINLYRRYCFCCKKHTIEYGFSNIYIVCPYRDHYLMRASSEDILEDFYFEGLDISIRNTKEGSVFALSATLLRLESSKPFGSSGNLFEEIELIKLLT